MAANSTSYDLIADFLSTNNTISVATLIGTFLFGVLAVYGCLLTWRHQQWQRQVQHGAVVNARDDLEAGPPAEENEMRDLGNTSNEETAVEKGSDGTYADRISGSQLGSSTPTAEGDITRSIETEASISREVGNIRVRNGDLDRPQSSKHVYDSKGKAAASPTSTSDHEVYTVLKGSLLAANGNATETRV